ncbi:MAG: ATP-binding protein [Peptococcaceae bacterium]|jgi:hypothetical protein|nr:ATP-binding protein [Peptococcaceae bacterium]
MPAQARFPNYRLFWEECPSYEHSECSVKAETDSGLSWSWKYRKAKLSDLGSQIIANNPVAVDSSTEFALWDWQTNGHVNERFSRAQILAPDGGLYLLPLEGRAMSLCKYLDFASLLLQPQKLSFNTSKQLTAALKILNPRVTDVRLTDIESGLSVVLDDSHSVTLGAIGNGAVTWASVLIAVLDVIESIKNKPQADMPVLLLIDEMGAGIHYSIMLDVWKYIRDFTQQYRSIQFVFTTHSDDCVRAYCEAFSGSNAAKIIRLHQTAADQRIVPTDYLEEQFNRIAGGDWEVRG